MSVYTNEPAAFFARRVEESKGTDTASASTLTLPNDGNFVEITGTTTIRYVTTTGWHSGSRVELYFAGALTLTNNAGTVPANTAPLKLAGGTNASMAAGSTISLRYDAGHGWWREVGRTEA
jgi:hypothetical protein